MTSHRTCMFTLWQFLHTNLSTWRTKPKMTAVGCAYFMVAIRWFPSESNFYNLCNIIYYCFHISELKFFVIPRVMNCTLKSTRFEFKFSSVKKSATNVKNTYLQVFVHLGGRVTFSLPHGTVIHVPLQAQLIVSVKGHG